MKVQVTDYAFNAALRKVTFNGYAGIRLDSVLIIVNVTDHIIIYNFADDTKQGTVAANVLTLEFDTTLMDNADDLLIYYDDPATAKELTERMCARAPAAGYRLWVDTGNAAHLYVLEAPAATLAGQVGFRGIRIAKDASGNPLGKAQVNVGASLTFDNRAADGGWG